MYRLSCKEVYVKSQKTKSPVLICTGADFSQKMTIYENICTVVVILLFFVLI